MFNGAWPAATEAQRGGIPGDMTLEGNPMGVVKLTLV